MLVGSAAPGVDGRGNLAVHDDLELRRRAQSTARRAVTRHRRRRAASPQSPGSWPFDGQKHERTSGAERPPGLDRGEPGLTRSARPSTLRVRAIRARRRIAPDVGKIVGAASGGDPEAAVEELVVHLRRGPLVGVQADDVVELTLAERDVHGNQRARPPSRRSATALVYGCMKPAMPPCARAPSRYGHVARDLLVGGVVRPRP